MVGGVYGKRACFRRCGRGARRVLGRLLAMLVAACALLPAWCAAQTGEQAPPALRLGGYELGRGLQLGDSGFTLGGYAKLMYEDESDRPPRLSLSHLSLFVWWEHDRFKFFSELDLEDAAATRYDHEDEERRYLALERAYLDYAVDDSLTLRAGKFLTPVGRWNQIHADPLVWTSSRPLVTREVFPGSAVGVMALGTLLARGQEVDYALYASGDARMRASREEQEFREAYGGRLNVRLPGGWQTGVSLGHFERRSDDAAKYLGGLDFLWGHQGLELSGEAVWLQAVRGPARVERGAFLQAAVPLAARLYGIVRVETLKRPGEQDATRMWVAGLNYRLAQGVALKAEVVRGTHVPEEVEQGFLASVSVLF